MPKLKRPNVNDDYFAWYKYYHGVDEVPAEFVLLTSLSCLSMTLGKRCWLYPKENNHQLKLCPNTNIILIAESGFGKNVVISEAQDLVDNTGRVQSFPGQITKQGLIDYLMGEENDFSANLIMRELSNSIPAGPMGVEFNKFLVENHTPNGRVVEMTRTHRDKIMYDICLNILAGTTVEWLIHTISPDELRGGTTARMIFGYAVWESIERVKHPYKPKDSPTVRAYLIQWLSWLFDNLRGEIGRTAEVIQMEDDWAFDFPRPSNENMLATWMRRKEMVQRFEILYYAGSQDVFEDMTQRPKNPMIRPHHFIRARDHWLRLFTAYPAIFDLAINTTNTKHHPAIKKQLIRLSKKSADGWVLRSKLHRAVPNGIDHNLLDMAVNSFLSEGLIERHTGGTTKRPITHYKWVG